MIIEQNSPNQFTHVLLARMQDTGMPGPTPRYFATSEDVIAFLKRFAGQSAVLLAAQRGQGFSADANVYGIDFGDIFCNVHVKYDPERKQIVQRSTSGEWG